MRQMPTTTFALSAGFLVLAACSDSQTPLDTSAVSPKETDISSVPVVTNETNVSTDHIAKKETNVSTDPVAAIEAFIADQNIDRTDDNWRTRVPSPPKVAFDHTRKVYWDLHTNKGTIRIQLMPDVAPMHVSSTIYLTTLGFYDGLAFHRVISDFMAQGGCPVGNGTGGPAYKYDGEFDDKVRHDRPGLLSMANSGPGTDGSQFFITFVPTPHLNGNHTIFGEVVDGMDTVQELERNGSPSGNPAARLLIEKAQIVVE